MELFYDRLIYQFRATEAAAENVVHFLAEKFLYGRVDRRYLPIALNLSEVENKYFSMAEGGSSTSFVAPAFVVDAFNDLTIQFQKSLLANKIRSNDKYLTAPKVFKAYKNPKLLYEEYSNRTMDNIKGQLTNKNIKFKNFDEFILLFMKILKTFTPIAPYTYPAYIKNKMCPISTTGLAIEIADIDCANDQRKVDEFINSRNWRFYLNACKSYGFLVDGQIPWRIVADLSSTEMLKYAAVYGYESTEDILLNVYKPAYVEYYNGFKTALLSAYNALKSYGYTEIEHCRNTPPKTTVIYPQEYTTESLADLHNESYFFKLYLQIRIFEERPKFTDSETNRLIEDTMDLYRVSGVADAMFAFERIIATPYSYSGSLTSRRKGDILKAEEEFQKEELQGVVSTYR